MFRYSDTVASVWSCYLLLVCIISEILCIVRTLCQYGSQTEIVTVIDWALSNYKESISALQFTHSVPFRNISWLTFWLRTFLQILAHPVFKM